MSYYETLFIVHPALEAGRLKDIILSFDESLKKDNSSQIIPNYVSNINI